MDTRSSFLGIAGWGTTLALLFGWLSSLGSNNEPPPAPPSAKASVSQSCSGRAGAQHPDSQVAVTGRQLLDEFLGENADTSCPRAGRYRLGVLFVTVPDPIDSHLDWAYDAQLNATRRALERDSYVIDRFWVPWTSPRDTSSAAKRGRGSSVRADYPGVMLFRRSRPSDNRLRLIYVVGEIPTAGVHKTALLRALTEADSLLRQLGSCLVRDSSMGPDIRIVGPAFSGSAP